MKFGSDSVLTTSAPRLANVMPYMLQYWQEPPLVSFSIVLRTLLRSVPAAPNCSDLNAPLSNSSSPPTVEPVTSSVMSVPDRPM